MEIGNAASPWVQPNITDELRRCQGYFYSWIGGDIHSPQYNNSNSIISISLPVRMRATPTVTRSITNSGSSISDYINRDMVQFLIIGDLTSVLTAFTADAELAI